MIKGGIADIWCIRVAILGDWSGECGSKEESEEVIDLHCGFAGREDFESAKSVIMLAQRGLFGWRNKFLRPDIFALYTLEDPF